MKETNKKTRKNIKESLKLTTLGFTLVELLAVIVILAIILVIAVPKVMSVIEDAKKATLESTAKMIASQAEKQKVQNTVLGNDKEITCEDITNINDVDYEDCDIVFDNNTAKVTITGAGKFEGLYVCDGTKTIAEAQIEQCKISSVSLPALGTSAEDCTWEQIKAISDAGKADEYFNLGDTKTVTLTTGEQVVMEIVAFDADTKTSGGTAAITWLSKHLIAQRAMNSTASGEGGWEASEMRNWLQTDVYNTIPAEVQNAIVEVNKTYYDYDSNNHTTKTCSNKVWIPSYCEMYGITPVYETSGATYSNYFTSDASRVKNYGGIATWWWLRSNAYTNTSISFGSISSNGSNMHYSEANILGGVALGFCTD